MPTVCRIGTIQTRLTWSQLLAYTARVMYDGLYKCVVCTCDVWIHVVCVKRVACDSRRWRNAKTFKAYVAIFVCLATRVVHIELVNDQTTEAFLAALKRFFARRRRAKHIYSDNARTFVGTSRELHNLTTSPESSIRDYLTHEQVTWHFIPPRAPHFGGIWKAAVKSMKGHLLKIVGNNVLTFEAMNTYLIEIEAILNSRPITTISSDPNDLTALTPSHFLIGDVLTSIPEKDVTDIYRGTG